VSEFVKKVRFAVGKCLIAKEITMRKSGVAPQVVQNEGINGGLAINVRGDPPKPSFALAAMAAAWQTQADRLQRICDALCVAGAESKFELRSNLLMATVGTARRFRLSLKGQCS